jgi:hypothetical protein
MNYLVINTSKYNFTQNENGVFFAIPIISGEHMGKFACFENALELFPEVFEIETYEEIDLNNSVFSPNFTPPTLSPYAVEIIQEYRWVFPEDKFILSGFEIPLDNYQTTKVVNLAYFQWVDFRQELDKKDADGNFVYATLKRSLMPLWDYVAEQVQNGNVIVL